MPILHFLNKLSGVTELVICYVMTVSGVFTISLKKDLPQPQRFRLLLKFAVSGLFVGQWFLLISSTL